MSTRTNTRPRYIDGTTVHAMRTFTDMGHGCRWLVYRLRDPEQADRVGNRSPIQYCYTYREALALVQDLDYEED